MEAIKLKLKTPVILVAVAAILSLFVVLMPTPVLAGETCGGVEVSIGVGCKGDANPIYSYIKGVMGVLSILVGVVIVGAIVVGGIGYASARDDKGQIQKSQDIIRNAIIALLLYIGMAAILNALVPGGIIT